MIAMPVRTGVVDTGVDSDHPTFKRRKPKGIGVRWQGDDYCLDADFHDLHGHGTAMAAQDSGVLS